MKRQYKIKIQNESITWTKKTIEWECNWSRNLSFSVTRSGCSRSRLESPRVVSSTWGHTRRKMRSLPEWRQHEESPSRWCFLLRKLPNFIPSSQSADQAMPDQRSTTINVRSQRSLGYPNPPRGQLVFALSMHARARLTYDRDTSD